MYRVTEIIQNVLLSGEPMPDEWYLRRGEALHACISLELQGKKYQSDERLAGYIRAGKKWITDYKPEVLMQENRLEAKRLNLTGTPDLVCKIKDEITIVDFKTNQEAWWNKYQLGGYAWLLKENKLQAKFGMIVALCEGGDYKVSKYKLDNLIVEFRAIYTVYAILKEHGKIKEERKCIK